MKRNKRVIIKVIVISILLITLNIFFINKVNATGSKTTSTGKTFMDLYLDVFHNKRDLSEFTDEELAFLASEGNIDTSDPNYLDFFDPNVYSSTDTGEGIVQKVQGEQNSREKSGGTSVTSDESKKRAEEIKKELLDNYYSRKLEDMTDNELALEITRINNYLTLSGTLATYMPDELKQYYTDIQNEQSSRGLKRDNSLYEDANRTVQEANDSSKKDVNIGSSTMGKVDRDSSHTLGEIIDEGGKFISSAEGEQIKQENLQKMSNTIYNILLVLGIVIAVVVGVVLGIKFITEGVEGQAEVKKALVPYIIGCVVVFGAFIIWKIVVDILQSM